MVYYCSWTLVLVLISLSKQWEIYHKWNLYKIRAITECFVLYLYVLINLSIWKKFLRHGGGFTWFHSHFTSCPWWKAEMLFFFVLSGSSIYQHWCNKCISHFGVTRSQLSASLFVGEMGMGMISAISVHWSLLVNFAFALKHFTWFFVILPEPQSLTGSWSQKDLTCTAISF